MNLHINYVVFLICITLSGISFCAAEELQAESATSASLLVRQREGVALQAWKDTLRGTDVLWDRDRSKLVQLYNMFTQSGYNGIGGVVTVLLFSVVIFIYGQRRIQRHLKEEK